MGDLTGPLPSSSGSTTIPGSHVGTCAYTSLPGRGDHRVKDQKHVGLQMTETTGHEVFDL